MRRWLCGLLIVATAVIGDAPIASAGPTDVCYTESGHVFDAVGTAIAGATVTRYTGPAGCGSWSTTTDANGAWQLQVPATFSPLSVSVTASAPGFASSSITPTPAIDNPIVLRWSLALAPDVLSPPPNFGYDLPAALPGGTVTVAVLTRGAPSAFTVRATLRDINGFIGTPQNFAPTGPDASGLYRWSGSIQLPNSPPDRNYVVDACGVVPGYLGTCTDARNADGSSNTPPLTLRAADPGGGYSTEADSSPPAFSNQSPTPFTTAPRYATPSVQVWDPGGVDRSSIDARVDGQAVTVTSSGTSRTITISFPTSTGTGAHLVSVSVSDYLGHTAQTKWLYAAANVATTPVTATLHGVTVPVAKSATDVESTVTFTTPAVDVGRTNISLSAVGGTGSGLFRRWVDLGAVNVLFQNGPLNQTVSVGTARGYANYPIAALSASQTQVTAALAPQTMAIPSITVDVPAPFRTYGSTATLISATSTLPASAFETSYPILGGNFNGTTVEANLSVDACLRRDSSNATVVCTDGAPPYATVTPAGSGPLSLVLPDPQALADPDPNALESTLTPSCAPADGSTGCLNSPSGGQVWQIANNAIRVGCTPLQFALLPTTNSCDPNASPSTGSGYGTAYLNAFVFADPAGGFPTLQQDKVATGTDRCPAGGTGSASGAITRATSVVQSIDGATSSLTGGSFFAHTYGGGVGVTAVRVGAQTSAASTASETQNPNIPLVTPGVQYQLDSSLSPHFVVPGWYFIEPNTLHAGDGVSQASTAAATVGWESSNGLTQPLQLLHATEFRNPNPSGGYGFVLRLDTQLEITFNCS
ncbi:MAG: hypothetical protein QOI95_10 [Acidimicrobiaceae bacterium]